MRQDPMTRVVPTRRPARRPKPRALWPQVAILVAAILAVGAWFLIAASGGGLPCH